MSMGMHWLGDIKVAGPVRARHLINGSLAIGRSVNRVLHRRDGLRWDNITHASDPDEFIQIQQ
jgi:hypothetical protein